MSLEPGEYLIDFTERFPGKTANEKEARNARIINSTVAYLAAFVTVYVSFYFFTAVWAKRTGLFAKFYIFKVEYTTNYNVWLQEPVTKTFLAGPIAVGIIGALGILLQKLFRKRPGLLKTFLLWLGVHGLNFLITQFALMWFKDAQKGFYASHLGVVADYYYWEYETKLIFSIAGFLFLIPLGAIVTKPFIQLTNSTQLIFKAESRIVYLFQVVFLPYIIGSTIALVYFRDGNNLLNTSLVISLFIVIISIFINGLKNRMIMIYRLPEKAGVENKFLIGLSAVLILMKVLFNNGFKF